MTEAEEFAAVQSALADIGVDGQDLARFVSTPYPGIIEPEAFDAVAAFPVLLEWLPRARHASVRDTLATRVAQGARTVGRKRLAAPAFVAALRREGLAGWALADALSRVLVPEVYDDVLDLAGDRSLGSARQLLVYSLWRVKDPRASAVVEASLEDEDVCLHAVYALKRMRGREDAVTRLRLLASSESGVVATAASRELRKLERAR